MKRFLIILLILIAALFLIHRRYVLIETHQALPEEIRLGLAAGAGRT